MSDNEPPTVPIPASSLLRPPHLKVMFAAVAVVVLLIVVVVAVKNRHSDAAVGTGTATTATTEPSSIGPAAPPGTSSLHPEAVVVAVDDAMNIGVFSQVDGHLIRQVQSNLSSSITESDNVGQAYFVRDGRPGEVGTDALNNDLSRIAVVRKYASALTTASVPAYIDISAGQIHDVEPPPDSSGFATVGSTYTEAAGYDPAGDNFWYVVKEDVTTYPEPSSFLVGPNYRREIPGSAGTSDSTDSFSLTFPVPGSAPDVSDGSQVFNGRSGSSRPFDEPQDDEYLSRNDLPETNFSVSASLISRNDPDTAFFVTTNPRMSLWKVPSRGGTPTEIAPLPTRFSYVIRAAVMNIN